MKSIIYIVSSSQKFLAIYELLSINNQYIDVLELLDGV